jgi:Family of unknown function (DUF6286)
VDRFDPPEPTTTLEDPVARSQRPHRSEPASADAKAPVRSTSLTILGLVWAAVLMAAGAVGIHDGLATTEAVDDPWIPRAIEYVDGIQPNDDVLIATGAGGLIGLVLVVLALWPRRRRKIVLRSTAGVSVRQRHLERMVAGRMETLDGVLRCRVAARGRTVTVEARSAPGIDTGKLFGEVASQARDDLDPLPHRPDLRILVREAD